MRQSWFADSSAVVASTVIAGAALATVLCVPALVPASHAQTPPAAPKPMIGRIVSATGTVAVERSGARAALAGNDTEIAQGDIIETIGDSGARIRFRDETELRLRAGTRMAVSDFVLNPANPSQERFATQLLKGGLRALSGLIARRNPASVDYRTTTATIGIRGTDFVMRLCADDCVAERGAAAVPAAPPAGRVTLARGAIVATNPEGATRTLTSGNAVFPGDVLRAAQDAAATVVFRDDSRLALQGGTVLGIERYSHDPARGRGDAAVFRLFAGAFRAVTGALAQRNPANFRVRTATATVGIRGTVFDVVCRGSCAESPRANREATTLPAANPPLADASRVLILDAVAARFAAVPDRQLVVAVSAVVLTGLVADAYVARGLAQEAGGAPGAAPGTAPAAPPGVEAPEGARVAQAATTEAAIGLATTAALNRLLEQGQIAPAGFAQFKEALDAALTSPPFRTRLAALLTAPPGTAAGATWNAVATEAVATVTGALLGATGGTAGLQQGLAGCVAPQCDPWLAESGMQAWALAGAAARAGGPEPYAPQFAAGVAAGQALAAGAARPGGGLIVSTDAGSTFIDSGSKITEIRAGQTALVAIRQGEPAFIDKPAGMPGETGERPEGLKPDLPTLFGTAAAPRSGGFLTLVNSGSISVADGGTVLTLEAGESSFSDGRGGPPIRVDPPAVLLNDRFLSGTTSGGMVCSAR